MLKYRFLTLFTGLSFAALLGACTPDCKVVCAKMKNCESRVGLDNCVEQCTNWGTRAKELDEKFDTDKYSTQFKDYRKCVEDLDMGPMSKCMQQYRMTCLVKVDPQVRGRATGVGEGDKPRFKFQRPDAGSRTREPMSREDGSAPADAPNAPGRGMGPFTPPDRVIVPPRRPIAEPPPGLPSRPDMMPGQGRPSRPGMPPYMDERMRREPGRSPAAPGGPGMQQSPYQRPPMQPGAQQQNMQPRKPGVPPARDFFNRKKQPHKPGEPWPEAREPAE